MKTINERIEDLKNEVVNLRREIHMFPEIAFEEFRTSEIVYNYLNSIGLEVKKNVNKTGVVADLIVNSSFETVLLRADMDALPIQEENNVPYKSKIPNRMHACGHDAHTAMLLVAAKVISEYQNDLKANVRFVFQPSEEKDPGGALGMIKEGVLENPKVNYAFALHVSGFHEKNKVLIRSGIMTAEADEFAINVKGYGGHGAYPHKSIDPILIASHIVIASQSIVSRNIDPLKSVVLSFGKISSGDVFNVIPGSAFLLGTVRSLEHEDSVFVKERLEMIAKNIASAFGGSAEMIYNFGYPPSINNEKATEYIRSIAREVVGEENLSEAPISMGGEDMSYFLEKTKGAFYWLGALNKEKGISYPNHSPKFDIDEDILTTGVKLHVLTVLNFKPY